MKHGVSLDLSLVRVVKRLRSLAASVDMSGTYVEDALGQGGQARRQGSWFFAGRKARNWAREAYDPAEGRQGKVNKLHRRSLRFAFASGGSFATSCSRFAWAASGDGPLLMYSK